MTCQCSSNEKAIILYFPHGSKGSRIPSTYPLLRKERNHAEQSRWNRTSTGDDDISKTVYEYRTTNYGTSRKIFLRDWATRGTPFRSSTMLPGTYDS